MASSFNELLGRYRDQNRIYLFGNLWKHYMGFPQLISDILPQVLSRMGLAQKVKEAEIVRDWSVIVGEAVARHCQPVGLDKGYLTVNVDSSPWLNELQRFSKGLILQKLRARLGEKVIRDIRFRIGEINAKLSILN